MKLSIVLAASFLLLFSLTWSSVKCDDEQSMSNKDLVKDELLIPQLDDENDDDKEEVDDSELGAPIDVVEDPPAIDKGDDKDEVLSVDEGSGDSPVIRMMGVDESDAEQEPVCRSTNAEDSLLAISCDDKSISSLSGLAIDVGVTTLSLNNNNVSEIADGDFPEKMENLKELSLDDNDLKRIDEKVFSRMPRLERLNLSGNALTSLDMELFSGLLSLERLELSGNPILLPADTPFLMASKLRRLSLANCQLTQVPENTFDGMTALEDVDLGRNPINESTPITVGVFAALTNLSSLTLPQGAPRQLLEELCRGHGLLTSVCLDSCREEEVSCQEGEDASTDQPTVPVATLETLSDPIIKKSHKNRTKENLAAPEESVPESSRSGVKNAGGNSTVVAIMVGGVLLVGVGIALKKNWGRLTGRTSRDIEGAPPVRLTAVTQEQAEEAVPLQTKQPPPV